MKYGINTGGNAYFLGYITKTFKYDAALARDIHGYEMIVDIDSMICYHKKHIDADIDKVISMNELKSILRDKNIDDILNN